MTNKYKTAYIVAAALASLVALLGACTPAPVAPVPSDALAPDPVTAPAFSPLPTPDSLEEDDTLKERSAPKPSQETPLPASEPISGIETSVIVQLDFEPLATYGGGIEGLSATNPAITGETRLDVRSEASQAYLAYLEAKVDAFEQALAEAIPEARIVHRYTVTLAGVSVLLSSTEVERLRRMPGVVSVRADSMRYPDSATGAADVQETDQ